MIQGGAGPLEVAIILGGTMRDVPLERTALFQCIRRVVPPQ